MVNGVYSEYQRRNTLGTAPETWQRFNSELQLEHINESQLDTSILAHTSIL